MSLGDLELEGAAWKTGKTLAMGNSWQTGLLAAIAVVAYQRKLYENHIGCLQIRNIDMGSSKEPMGIQLAFGWNFQW